MRTQTIRTAPRKLVVSTYLTTKGVRLKKEGASKDVLSKYTKNRVIDNPNSKPLTRQVINSQGKLVHKQRQVQHVK